VRWHSHEHDRHELKHPTLQSSISYINSPRHPRSAHFPPTLLNTLLIFQGTDNADAVLSVEVKCVQAFGMYHFGSEREPSSLVSSYCQTDVFSGSEIYVGCSNGEILLFALQADGPDEVRSRHYTRSSRCSDCTQPETYTLLSRKMLPTEKAVDEIVLAPSISRALVLSGKSLRS
jgi:hypothetical protein